MLLPLRFQLLQPALPPEPPQPPAPSGGLSWLRDYKPKFDYEPKPPARQREEEEALLMLALA